jgi:hypothetical protein
MPSAAMNADGARAEVVPRRVWRARDTKAEFLAEQERDEWRRSPAGYFPAIIVGHEYLGEMPIETALVRARELNDGSGCPDVRPLGDVERSEAPAEEPIVNAVAEKGEQLCLSLA